MRQELWISKRFSWMNCLSSIEFVWIAVAPSHRRIHPQLPKHVLMYPTDRQHASGTEKRCSSSMQRGQRRSSQPLFFWSDSPRIACFFSGCPAPISLRIHLNKRSPLALEIGFFTAQIQRCRHNRNGFPRFSSSDSGRAILADNSWDSSRLVSNLRPAKEDPCMDEVMPKKVGLDL